MVQISIRTEWAGVPNSKRDVAKSAKIGKKFGARVIDVSDKDVLIEVADSKVASYKREMSKAGVAYLIGLIG